VAPFSSYIQNSVKISSNLTGKNSLDLKKLKKHFRIKVPSAEKFGSILEAGGGSIFIPYPELSEIDLKFNGKKFFSSKKAEETLSN
jgi:hypothetical protein